MKPSARKAKALTKEQKELRERAPLDTSKNEVENYLGGLR